MNQAGIFYPDVMPTPIRLADGSVYTQMGGVLPFAASCPPDFGPDGATRTCVPEAGARNINYECGGVLVPSNAPGCAADVPQRAAQFAIQALEVTGVKPRWPGCLCSETPNEMGATAGAGTGRGSLSKADSLFACFLVGVAVLAAFTRK